MGASRVPAAEQTLQVLTHLARHASPLPAARIAADLGLPRSTVYHLLNVLVSAGYAVHLPEERRYGLGVAALQVGTAYTHQAPLGRLARPVLARLVDATGFAAHLAVLHGREVLYVVEERAPGRPPLVTDVGVRLPATLTASGRAMLAALPAPQVRALFPDRDSFVQRGSGGPDSPSALRRLLVDARARGYAVEDGEVTAGFASVAYAVVDHAGLPAAGLATTYPADEVDNPGRDRLVAAVAAAASELGRRIGGQG
ncbi:DNA-binding IclR family transcriptional regulator [Motilibacter peucedani]|uniref:DNA-binding IclR family transcriptional regulator n=1 Tax=Motilibacter peucedani TaxID=598650 RepID=A0A420XQY5_9ACTN|nr:IclR family transcriptional regulator [Motilibacter peucedani]RKS75657.1 DNA-binding IclR family transcriptional regulator [Motilibacter peucedani]